MRHERQPWTAQSSCAETEIAKAVALYKMSWAHLQSWLPPQLQEQF
jgi:hypothetical protein